MGEAFGNAVDATYCRHDPYLVANANFAVPSYISLEGGSIKRCLRSVVRENLWHRMVFVGERSLEVGLEVVLVDPLPSLQVDGCVADGVAIFYNVLARGCVVEQDFMTCGRVLQYFYRACFCDHRFSLLHRFKAYYYCVGGIDFDVLRCLHCFTCLWRFILFLFS